MTCRTREGVRQGVERSSGEAREGGDDDAVRGGVLGVGASGDDGAVNPIVQGAETGAEGADVGGAAHGVFVFAAASTAHGDAARFCSAASGVEGLGVGL